jgi:hypothetical protein
MMDHDRIETHSLARDFVEANDVVLGSTPTTRTVFRPQLHRGGVRGFIVRQKRGADGSWADTNEVNFAKLPADCGVRIELDTAATRTLTDSLTRLYELQAEGVAPGDRTYVVAEQSRAIVLDDTNKAAVIRALLDQGLSEEFWAALSAEDPDLATRLAAGRVQFNREAVIGQFETGLVEHPDDESHWQRFFESHRWILRSAFSSAVYFLGGEVYLGGKRPIGRQGKGGVATDFLFSEASTKSFAVVEIKTPETGLVGGVYRGGRDELPNVTYSMHPALTGGIVQTRNQIAQAVESFESVLGPGFDHRLNRIHPKGVLIIGRVDQLDARQQESLNLFRQGLYSLTVIGFDELLTRLQILYSRDDVPGDGVGGRAADDDIAL